MSRSGRASQSGIGPTPVLARFNRLRSFADLLAGVADRRGQATRTRAKPAFALASTGGVRVSEEVCATSVGAPHVRRQMHEGFQVERIARVPICSHV